MKSLKPSAIREILKNSSDPSVIPLSAGNPAPDAFPYEAVRKISQELLQNTPIDALQYGVTEGYTPLRQHLMGYMAQKHHVGTQDDDILITSGAQQVMDLLTKTLLNEGDTVLCEAPSFIGSLNTFRSYRAKLVGIPMEEDGIDTQKLEEALNTEKNVKYLYTIPNFQNPSGITMSLEKRKKVYELCREHNVIILEDNPYGDLRFAGEDVPSIKSLDTEGVVVYAGSFSKVISPGMRVGYAIGPKAVLQKMVVCKQGEDVHSNMWAQIVCHRIMTEYDFEAHLENLRAIYRRKSSILLEAMERYFKPLASPGAILRAACSPGAPCPPGWICWSLSKRPRSTRCAWCRAPLSSPTRASPASPAASTSPPPPTSSSPRASACWPKPMRK